MRSLFSTISLVVFLAGCGKAEFFANQTQADSRVLTLAEADRFLESQGPQTSLSLQKGLLLTEVADSLEASSVQPAAIKAELIQTALKNLNLYHGEIDGKIGPKTREAIMAFQEQNNLIIDGEVGPQTWFRLKKGLLLRDVSLLDGEAVCADRSG